MEPFSIAGSVAASASLVVLALTIPGLLGRVRDPEEKSAVRGLALAIVLLLLAAAWDVHSVMTRPRPLDLSVVATGGAPALVDSSELRGTLRSYSARGSSHGVVEALVAAGLSRPRDGAPVALEWTVPPIGVPALGPLPAFPVVAGATLWSERRPLPFEPADAVRLELARPAVVARPNELRVTVQLPDPAWDLGPSIELQLHGVDDASKRFTADAERERSAEQLVFEWEPETPGAMRVRAELRFVDAPYVVRFEARFDVAPEAERAVVVLAAPERAVEAENLCRALNAQRVPSVFQAVDGAGLDLESAAAVVALSRLDLPEQRALADFVDDGGGLLLAGGDDFGALPRSRDEPLHRLLPVECPPPTGVGSAGDGATDDPSAASGTDGSSEESPSEIPPVRPSDTPEKPDKPERPEKPLERPDGPDAPSSEAPAAVGDVADAGSASLFDMFEEADRIKRRRVALVLVVDRSGSMMTPVASIGTRMDFAKKAAFETARRLDAEDRLGVVTFATSSVVVRRIEPVGSDVDKNLAIVRGIRVSAGATNMYTGIAAGISLLQDDPSPVRHLVVVTDGLLESTVQILTEAEAKNARAKGITVSVIHIRDPYTGTDNAQPGMLRIAEAFGGGRYRATRDPTAVPALVVSEVLRVAGRGPNDGRSGPGAGQDERPDAAGDEPPAARDEPQEASDPVASEEPGAEPQPGPEEDRGPVDEPDPAGPAEADTASPRPDPIPIPVVAVADSPLLAPQSETFPELRGLVDVRLRLSGRPLLATDPDGVPVLVLGHHGLGRLAVWSADLTGEQSRAWREDPSFPGRLAQWVTWLAQPAAEFDGEDPLALDAPDRRVEPAVPTPSTVRALSRLARVPAGDRAEPLPLRDLASLRSEPSEMSVARPLVPWFALAAIAGIVLLAWIERLVRAS